MAAFLNVLTVEYNNLKNMRCGEHFTLTLMSVFVAFRPLNMLQSVLRPHKAIMAKRFDKDETFIETMLTIAAEPVADDYIPGFKKNLNSYDPEKHPNKRIWINVDHAMQHANDTVPDTLLKDAEYVANCTCFLSHLLASECRGTEMIEASLYLLKIGHDFLEIVLYSPTFIQYAKERKFDNVIPYLLDMTKEQKAGFYGWLVSMECADE
jgi:hypothetical protein